MTATPSASTGSFAEAACETGAAIARALALEPLALDPALARCDGAWKGMPVRIETRAWRGGIVRYARVATVTGAGLEIGNVLAVPRADHPLPILGADLVALGGRAGLMVAMDLSPMLQAGPARDRQLDDFGRRMAAYADLPSGGELPAWCRRWFSAHALYVRPGEEARSRALAALRDAADAWIALAAASRSDPASAEATARAQAGYAAAHREDDRGLGMLARMFGEDWAARYLREALFPA